jgi:hypothetical protein
VLREKLIAMSTYIKKKTKPDRSQINSLMTYLKLLGKHEHYKPKISSWKNKNEH